MKILENSDKLDLKMAKKILIVIGSLAGLLIVSVILFTFLFDINKFQPKIKAILEEKLNAKITLGNMELSLIKGLGAKIDGLSISNPSGFPTTSLFEVPKIYISLGTFRSLLGSPHLALYLEHPKLHLLKNEKNELNLKHLFQKSPPIKKEDAAKTKEDLPQKEIPAFAGVTDRILRYFLSRGSISLYTKNGELTYPKDPKTKIEIENLDITLEPLSLTSDANFLIQGVLKPMVFQKQKIKGPFQFKFQTSNPSKFKDGLNLKLEALLNSFEIESNQILKTKEHPLSLRLETAYTKNNLELQNLTLTHPFGDFKLTGNIENIHNPKFNWKTLLIYRSKEAKENIPSLFKHFDFKTDLTLNAQIEGLLLPFFIQKGEGSLNINDLKSPLPELLKEKLLGQKITADGSFQAALNGAFVIKEHRLEKLSLPKFSIDLTQLALGYEDKFKKEAQIPLKLTSEVDFLGNEKKISFKNTNLQFQTLESALEGSAQFLESPLLRLKLSTQPFSLSDFKGYLPPTPFQYQGKLSIPNLVIDGNPLDFKTLKISGELSIPKDKLELNPSFFKEKKWKAEGPIYFESQTQFEMEGKKLKKFVTNTKANFTNAQLALEKQFIKPKTIPFEIDAKAQLQNNTLQLPKLNFTFHNLSATTSGEIQNIYEKTKRTLNWNISTPPFALDDWNDFFPSIQQKYKGSAAFQKFQIKFPLHQPKKLSLSGKFDLKNIEGEIPKDLLSGKTFKLEGPFALNLTGNIQTYQTAFRAIDLKGNMDLSQTVLYKKDVFSKKTKTPLKLNIDLKTQGTTAAFHDFSLLFQDIRLKATGDIQSISKNPNYHIKLSISPFELASLKENLLFLKDKPISLQNIEIKSEIKGKLHTKQSPIYANISLKASEFNIPKPAEEKPSEVKDKEKTSEDPRHSWDGITPKEKQKPSSFLDRLHLNGSLELQKLKYHTYEASKIFSQIDYQNHVLNLKTLQLNLYDGAFSSIGQIQLKDKPIKASLEANLSQLNIEKFLTSQESKLLGKLSGTLGGNLKLTFQDQKWEKARKNLKASGNIHITDGYFKVFNLTEAISQVPVVSEVVPNIQISDRFSKLSSSMYIKDEHLITPDIKLEAKDHLLLCEGKAGFDGSLDYKGSYYLSAKPDFKREIPFTVTGTVSNPVPLPDFGKLLKNKVQGVLEEILTPKSKGQETETQEKEESGNIIEDILKDTLP